MNISSVLNPSAAIGQISVWLVAILIGFIGGGYAHYKFMTEECPPVTQINNDIKTKARSKKSGETIIDLGLYNKIGADSCDYALFLDRYIQGTTVKQFRKAKK